MSPSGAARLVHPDGCQVTRWRHRAAPGVHLPTRCVAPRACGRAALLGAPSKSVALPPAPWRGNIDQ